MTTLFACAYGVTSLFPSKFQFQEHVAFQLVTVIFGLRQAHLHYFQRCKTSIEELLFKVLNEKTHLETLLATCQKWKPPPLALKKLQTPPGDSFAYYYSPPLAEGQRGVWDLQANAAPT